ncbi:MAG: dienelactone hydrolase family protein [Rhizobiales bacterium]|nr:dienelactone hydrolase family protein [Hyphomicrobiales bacterium]
MSRYRTGELLGVAIVAMALTCSVRSTAAPGAPPPPKLVTFDGLPARAGPLTMRGYLRRPPGNGQLPAVVLLHSCNSSGHDLDARWGAKLASWGFVTLTLDNLNLRTPENTCGSGLPPDFGFDAYRALNFLARQPFVNPANVTLMGFSQGGYLTLLSTERGLVERLSKYKFRAAIAFYPLCTGFKGVMTVPTLILIGARDDWMPAEACRTMAEGRDDWGISRQKSNGAPIQLIVYPDAYHAFDIPELTLPIVYAGHRLQFDEAAAHQSFTAVRRFLDRVSNEKP